MRIMNFIRRNLLALAVFLILIAVILICVKNLLRDAASSDEARKQLQVIACHSDQMIESVPGTNHLVYCKDTDGNISLRSYK